MTYTIASITYLKILTKTGLMQSYLLMLFMLLGLHYRFAGGSLMEPCDHAADPFAIGEFYSLVTNAYMA